MSGWLLDTDVLSAFAPNRTPIEADVAGWFRDRSNSLFLSTITVAEIEAGIAKLRRTGATRRASDLRSWFDRVTTLYGERVLPFDSAAAQIAGQLSDNAIAGGRHPGFADVAIAAIAEAWAHGSYPQLAPFRGFRDRIPEPLSSARVKVVASPVQCQ